MGGLYGNESQEISRSTPLERAINSVFGRKTNIIRLRDGISPEDFRLYVADYKSGSETAHNSLMSLTGVDFGNDYDAWQKWFDENGWKTKEDWSLDCLEAGGVSLRGKNWREFIPELITALMHESHPVRMQAYRLLLHYTGRTIPYSPGGKPEARLKSQARWWKWWNKGGKTAHGAAAGPETVISLDPRVAVSQTPDAGANRPAVPPEHRTHEIEKERVSQIMNIIIIGPLVLLGVFILLGIFVAVYSVIKEHGFVFFIKGYGLFVFLIAAFILMLAFIILRPKLRESARFSKVMKIPGIFFLLLMSFLLLAIIVTMIYWFSSWHHH